MGKALKIAGAVLAGLALLLVIVWAAMRRDDIPYSKLEAKYATAHSRYVDLPGGFHVHFRDQGNPKGPTLVLVHGFFVDLDVWEPWVRRLGADYRLVTLDLPGHGLTRAPEGYHASLEGFVRLLDAFVRAERIDRFTLVGFSLGGDVAWRYALAHPDKLSGLVLVDATGWPDPRPGHANGAPELAIMRNPVGRFMARDLDQTKRIHDGFMDAYANKRFVTEELVTKYAELNRAPGHRGEIIDLSLAFAHETYATRDKLAAIRTPTLILEGARDALVPPSSESRFAAAIPGSRLILYPGVGHIGPAGSGGQIGGRCARLPEIAGDAATAPCAAVAGRKEREHDDLLLTRRQTIAGITRSGGRWPSWKVLMLRMTRSPISSRASWLADAMCGRSTTFFRPISAGLISGSCS
jgi:pimeloyl-ACP methyl ester carboxylesterase